MAKYQKKPSIVDVAARRKQTVSEMLAEWSVRSYEELVKRCKHEGVSVPADLAPLFVKQPDEELKAKNDVDTAPKNALVDMSKKPMPKSDAKPEKKHAKGKVTLDGPAADDKHDGVDPSPTARVEDAS